MVHILKHPGRHRKRPSNYGLDRISFQRRMLCALALIVWAWMAGFVAVYEFVGHDKATSDAIPATQNVGSEPNNALSTQRKEIYDSPLLLFTCHRAQYLRETLEHVYEALPSCDVGVGCPIVISEDGGAHEEIKAVVDEFRSKFDARSIPIIHIHHNQLPQHVRVGDPNAAYKALAVHFGWALTKIYDGSLPGDYKPSYPAYEAKYPLPQRVIILEEDIKVSPDFFSYMAATADILDRDPTLYAVSAFNDNGHLVQQDSERLLRSDFFPGLGWMMTRKLWKDEFEGNWPGGFWDDWMREPVQRKGRQVIRPEVSRTYHFGRKGGASANQFGKILEAVKLDTTTVDWQHHDLSYLLNDAFHDQYTTLVENSRLVSSLEEAKTLLKSGNVRWEYDSFHDFQELARSLGIMDDEKAMVPRTAYQGIVECRPFGGSNILFLTPLGGKPFY